MRHLAEMSLVFVITGVMWLILARTLFPAARYLAEIAAATLR